MSERQKRYVGTLAMVSWGYGFFNDPQDLLGRPMSGLPHGKTGVFVLAKALKNLAPELGASKRKVPFLLNGEPVSFTVQKSPTHPGMIEACAIAVAPPQFVTAQR